MNFEWDEAKARRNIAKHGVSFTLAQEHVIGLGSACAIHVLEKATV